jgi:hypothetical protein
LIAKKLKIDTRKSSNESIAEANTATDPLSKPAINLMHTNKNAVLLAIIVAFF